jgi:hypothetical protein
MEERERERVHTGEDVVSVVAAFSLNSFRCGFRLLRVSIIIVVVIDLV